MNYFQSTKIIELGSCAFRQPNAKSHCRWLHGYRLHSKLWFGCTELDENNWVVDFGSLKGLKTKFEKQFDHTTCVAANDPALYLLTKMQEQDMCDLRVMDNGVGIERFAEWCFTVADSYVKSMTNNRCWIDKVEVWEHEKNSAAVQRAPRTTAWTMVDDIKSSDTSESTTDVDDSLEEQSKEDSISDKHPNGDIKQIKTKNSWVDPDVANKPNSWLF